MHPPKKLHLTASVLLCFVLQSLGADNYNNNNGQTYEFGFKIDGQQHRHESKDKDGIIMGEFGFVTADDVYHVTVYATDKEGRFKILSMKNIHLKSSPASMPGGSLSSRQGHALALPATPPVSGQASVVPQALSASTEKPTGSCASCLKIPDTTPRPYNNNNQNQFGASGTGPQNKQVFTPSPHPHGPQNSSPGGPSDSSNNGPAFPLPPYGQQNTSPGGPSVSSNIEPPFPPSPYGQQSPSPGGPSDFSHNGPAFPLSPYGQQNTSPGGPSVSSNGEPAFPPSPFGQQNASPSGPSVSSNGGPAFPPSPLGQQNASPSGPSVSSNGGPAFPPSPFGQQNTSPGGPSVSSNGGPAFPPSPFGQQNTSPGGPSVSSNGGPAFSPSPFGQQNPSSGGPNVSSHNKHTGERTAKQFNDLSKQFDSQLGPNGSRGQVLGPNQGGPAKPTLVTAQLQIVDKNTDVYALGPNEMKGLPPGLSQDDITTLLYTFNYTVGFHGHFEEGYTNGVKKGYYFVTGRNGVRTRIDYIADDTGFHPTVTNDVLDLLSEDVPKPETEKDEIYGLKGYEFKWLFYPVESKTH